MKTLWVILLIPLCLGCPHNRAPAPTPAQVEPIVEEETETSEPGLDDAWSMDWPELPPTLGDTEEVPAIVLTRIRETLGEEVLRAMESDPSSITELDLSRLQLTAIVFLKRFTGLEALTLDDNAISDLEPLRALTQLHTLGLARALDVSPLVRDVREWASTNPQADLAPEGLFPSVPLGPLTSLSALRELDLSGNEWQIDNDGLVTVGRLRGLEVLDISTSGVAPSAQTLRFPEDEFEHWRLYYRSRDLTFGDAVDLSVFEERYALKALDLRGVRWSVKPGSRGPVRLEVLSLSAGSGFATGIECRCQTRACTDVSALAGLGLRKLTITNTSSTIPQEICGLDALWLSTLILQGFEAGVTVRTTEDRALVRSLELVDSVGTGQGWLSKLGACEMLVLRRSGLEYPGDLLGMPDLKRLEFDPETFVLPEGLEGQGVEVVGISSSSIVPVMR